MRDVIAKHKSLLNNLIGLISFIISVPFKSHDTGIDRKAKTKRTIPVAPKKVSNHLQLMQDKLKIQFLKS